MVFSHRYFVQRTCVTHHKRLARDATPRMKRSSHQFLSYADLSTHQHRAKVRPHAFDLQSQTPHRHPISYQRRAGRLRSPKLGLLKTNRWQAGESMAGG
jgi:hypothetical protein